MKETPAFTVFTPAYNSCDTLPRVYESLARQTYTSFEWLIVDDGSSDGTGHRVEKWQEAAAFPIRYIYQPNRGKHRAFNRAVKEAAGDLFICLDADDACVPEALGRFWEFWESIPEPDRAAFSGVTVHCTDASGKRIGDRFPEDCMDIMPVELNADVRIRGEKWVCYRTDILGRYPFPEIEGEKFIPEGLVWNRIGTDYKMRYVNDALRIYHRSPRGLTAQRRGLRIQNSVGARLFYKEAIALPAPYRVRWRNMINYIAFSLHAGIPFGKLVKDAGRDVSTILFFPSGYALYLMDRVVMRLKKT